MPQIGLGTFAYEYQVEDRYLGVINEIDLSFIKGNAWAYVYFSPNGTAGADAAIAFAQQMEKLLPDQIVPPSVLSFPDELNDRALTNYFKSITFEIRDSASNQITEAYTDNSEICIQVFPKNSGRELYMIGLYNVQTQTIEFKEYALMQSIHSCGVGMNYFYNAELKAGDKFEIRIAVDDTLVAVFPFEVR